MDELSVLAGAAARGDRTALQELVRLTQAEVWRLCAHLGDPSAADDLTQEVYLRAIKALPSFRGDATVRTWLLSIARRTVADSIRARQRRRALAGASPPGPSSVAAGDGQVELRALVRGLAEDRRAAFVLTQMLGLSYAEAAEVCSCPVGTIRSRVARAREELVAAITGLGDRRDRRQQSDCGS